MTNIASKNGAAPQGNGRIRRALPALGLVAAAISGYSSQSSGSSSELGPVSAPPLTVELIVGEATLLHYARAQGVGDGLRWGGALLPERLERRMAEVFETVASARTDKTAYQIDMAYSAGRLDAGEGAWSPEGLENYVRTIDFTQAGIREISDRATLRWETEFGIERARETVRTALAITLTGYADVSDLPPPAEGMGLAILADVSGHLSPLMDHLRDTAFVPPETGLPPGFRGFADEEDRYATNEAQTDQPEI